MTINFSTDGFKVVSGKRQDCEIDLGDGVWLPAALIFGTMFWLIDENGKLSPVDSELIKAVRPPR